MRRFLCRWLAWHDMDVAYENFTGSWDLHRCKHCGLDAAHWLNVHGFHRDPDHVRISEADVEVALFRYVFKKNRRNAA